MHGFSKNQILYTLVVFILTFGSGISHADDTEIYFAGANASTAEVRPNLLLILDSSGSMTATVSGTGKTRMELMKEAMVSIINDLEGINVGLMRFTNNDGGPVLFPISYIDDNASTVVSEPADTNPSYTYTVSTGNNDGEEELTGNTVSLSNPIITLGEIHATVAGTANFDKRVTAQFDAVHEQSSQVKADEEIELLTGNDKVGVRFTGVTIPQGATINSANLILYGENSGSNDDDSDFSVTGHDIDNSSSFAQFTADLSTRLAGAPTDNSEDFTNQNFGVTTGGSITLSVTEIIQEIICRGAAVGGPCTNGAKTANTGGNWQSGNALSLILHDNGGPRKDIHSYISTSNTSEHPQLVINYDTTAAAAKAQQVALYFPSVEIPQGASLTNAQITFTASADNDDTTKPTDTFNIFAQDADDADALSTTGSDISGRTAVGTVVTWDPPAFVQDTAHTTPDIKATIQDVINRTNWCGGNDMVIIIENTTLTAGDDLTRYIHSYDSDPTKAPILELTYDATVASGCYQETETAQVSADYDDVEEDSGTIQRTSGDLDLSDKLVGIRFQDIDIPKNATILSATLEVNADGTSTSGNPSVKVDGILEADTAQFANTDDYLTDLTKTSSGVQVTWALGDFTTDGAWHSVSVKDIVQEIVNQSGWASGNALGFVVKTASQNRPAESHDDDPSQAPKITINYEASAGTSSIVTVRERLIEEVNAIPASGWTPIVETLYEAGLYWRGDTMVYGKSRDGSSSALLSHPGSYCTAANNCPGATIDSDTDEYAIDLESGCDPDTEWLTSACNGSFIKGSPTYISPFSSTLTCQSNYQVLLTDGEANSNNIEDLGDVSFISGSGACETSGTNRGTFSDGEECGYDIVDYMVNNDQSTTLDNDQTVSTYTVGFNTSGLTNATNYLKDLAAIGEGTFSEATTATDLVSVFDAIISDVKSDPTSFVAPSLATNAFNRLLSRDEVYFGLFTPSYNSSWFGNTKKYNVCVSSGGPDEDTSTTSDNCTLGFILDKDRVEAVDTSTSKFKDTATSVWSDVVDGRQTTEGGVGGEITDYTTQTFFTDATSSGTAPSSGTSLLNSTNPGYQINTDTWDDTDTAHIRTLVCPTVSTTAGSDCEDRMFWALGKIIDADTDTDTSTTTRWAVNDVLHSSPAVVTYGGSDTDSDGEVDTFFDRIVVGTNDGALRFINGTTGKQEWKFYPQSLLSNLRSHFTNAEGDHLYGVDTTPTLRVEDVDGDGTIEPGDGDFVHVFFGMRRGGNFIYALDITPSSTITSNTTAIYPKFLWRIEGGTSGFERLTDTWSPPRVATIGISSGSTTNAVDVLIFGGGYDTAVDGGFGTTNTGGSDNDGNAVYMVDAATGEKIFSVSGTCASCGGSQIVHTDMDFSIPSRITIMDTDGDGFDDRLYFGDTGGQVWRVDIADDVSNSGSTSGREGSSVLGKLASISTSGTAADERQFFEPPAVVQVKDSIYSNAANGEYDYVLIGTGNRASPLETDVSNRFYAFRDTFIDAMPDASPTEDNLADSSYPQTGGPISHSISGNLIDVSTSVLDSTDTVTDASLGWYLDFDSTGTNGEKNLAAPTAVAGNVFFTTYLPETSSSTDLCAANVGSGSAFGLNILTTKSALDWDEDGTLEDTADRRKSLGGGIPSDVVPIFTKEGVVGIVGIEGGAAQLGTLTGLPRYRTYWYEEI